MGQTKKQLIDCRGKIETPLLDSHAHAYLHKNGFPGADEILTLISLDGLSLLLLRTQVSLSCLGEQTLSRLG